MALWLHLLGAKVIGVALKPEKGSIIFKEFSLGKKLNNTF